MPEESVRSFSIPGALSRLVFGKSKDPRAPGIFHKLSLIALFAWVGLGADGLSSCCYGPEQAYLALGAYPYFAIIVGLLAVLTVMLISASYAQIIEMFPTGGGGYLVASKLLSPACGMVSGCALLTDYVLTITVSVASGADAVFSFLPIAWQQYKLPAAVFVTLVLIVLNLRGVKESVLPLVPIFLTFVATHVFLVLYAILANLGKFGDLATGLSANLQASRSGAGWLGMLILIMRAYGMGAGTYTGIEAVSNGVAALREPKVKTARKTMLCMAVSLSFMVLGLMLAYLLYGVGAQAGRTFNAVVCEKMTAAWPARLGHGFVLVTLISEAALLFVAAQTGFIGGPNVLATMAKDRWVPVKFSLLSNRLVVQNGVLLIGVAALAVMVVTGGSVRLLVVFYSINVFITFSLSQLGMIRHWWKLAAPLAVRLRKLAVSVPGFALSALILTSLVILKFNEGGWISLFATGLVAGVVMFIKKEYERTRTMLRRLDDLVATFEKSADRPDRRLTGESRNADATGRGKDRTAVLFVSGYGGVGLHSLMSIIRLFGGVFSRFVFVQVGVIDADAFKGAQEIERLEKHTKEAVEKYARLMRANGYEAEGIALIGLDVAEEVVKFSPALAERYPRSVFFGGQLVFRRDSLVSRLLHNYAIFDMQRLLYQQGIQFVILPIRV